MKTFWGWVLKFGRLRIGYMAPKKWIDYGTTLRCWFFIFRNYPARDDEYNGMRIGGHWQFTILGLQIAYCYRKDFKSQDYENTKRKDTGNIKRILC